MAIGAAAVEILDRAQRLRLRRVAAAVMAGVADARHARLEQLRIAGAVRFVTVGAVFHYRRMLPNEWTAAFGMASQAILIGCTLNELLGIRRAMRIMATGACNLAFSVGHVRRTLQLSAAHLVALQAEFRLRLLCSTILGKRCVVPAVRGEGYMYFLLY